MSTRKCFACDRKLGVNPHHAVTGDGQVVAVGAECFKRILPVEGWQPPKGGPRLYRGKFMVDGFIWHLVERQ